jgi:uncharacterized membrane protein
MIAALGDPRIVRAAALLGAASGSRSTAGLAALALTAPSGRFTQRPARLGVAAAAGTELIMDKLPFTPSRLAHGGIVVRMAAGAASGALLARRQTGASGRAAIAPLASAAAVGAVAAATTTLLGAGWRALAARRFGHDLPGAVFEDLSTAALALLGTRT